MKDETKSVSMVKFVGLKSKMYLFIRKDDKAGKKQK